MLNIDEGDWNLYEQLTKEGMFKGTERKEQFLMAMIVGFRHKTKRPISKQYSGGFARVEYLKSEDDALIAAVGLHDTGSVEILTDKKKLYEIAEEYAHAGIQILADMVSSTQFGDFDKHFEKLLLETYSELFPDEEKE